MEDEGSEKLYQGATLKNYSSDTQENAKKDASKDLTLLDEKMREHLASFDTILLRSLLIFLETQTWMKQSTCASADDDLLNNDMD